MQDETIFAEKGTPQSGVLSSLLANIALDEIEKLLSNWIAEIPAFSPRGHRISKPNLRKRLLFVEYADDFAVFHPDKKVVESAKSLIEEFLKWAQRKHLTRSKVWIRDRYLFKDTGKSKSRLWFGHVGKKQEVIGISYFAETPIVSYNKIADDNSIYDNDFVY